MSLTTDTVETGKVGTESHVVLIPFVYVCTGADKFTGTSVSS